MKMTNKVEKMRASGSKRAASNSPSGSKKTKKQRNERESDHSKNSSFKSGSRNNSENYEGNHKIESKDSMHSKETRKNKRGRKRSESSSKDTSEGSSDYSKSRSRSSSLGSLEKDKGKMKKSGRYWGGDPSSEEKKSDAKDAEVMKGDRYWGGGSDKNDLEPGELSSHSQDADFKVGSRYYDDKPEQDSIDVKETNKSAEDYLVGKRYYEDKPENNVEIKNEKAGDNSSSVPTRKSKLDDPLLSRTGGAYIPPAKLRLMQASITDKSSVSYQRIAWEALKKSIHGHINKVNTSNIGIISRLLMKENIIRGRGLLCRSLLQAQAASPTFTNVYACLVSVVNSKFPNIGELLMKRVILQFKRGFKRNDKPLCIASCQFIAHLVNQQVAHEILALEMLTLLLESPTDDSVEVAVAFLKEVGQKLLELSPKGSNAIFDVLRNILHQGNLEKRVQYMIEVVFQVRKDGFRSFPSVDESLDLVEEEDRYTHILTLDEAIDPEDMLNVFKHDLEYELNEDKYKALKEEIIGGSSSEEESGDDSGEESDEEASDEEEEDAEKKESNNMMIIDETETNLVALRRTIYLTIQSSLDFEECCHKLLKMDIKPGQEVELCHMLLDCCAEPRTYEKFFGLLAQRFCQINRIYIAPFEEMFAGSYATVHRLDTNKLRNVARFFGHLLFTDAISWQVLQTIRLNEEETTSSSRIFIKILFQELAEYMGLSVLNQRLKDPMLQSAMEGLFPRDNPKNTRFAINFFTSIGLGGLTDELREHLKTQPKPSAVAQLVDKLNISSSSDSSSSSSSDSSDDSSSEESSSSSSNSEVENKNKKKNKSKEKITDKNKRKNSKDNQINTDSKGPRRDYDKNTNIHRNPDKPLNKNLKRKDAEKQNLKDKYNSKKNKDNHRRYNRRSSESEDEQLERNNDKRGVRDKNRDGPRRIEGKYRDKEVGDHDKYNSSHNMRDKNKDRHDNEGTRDKEKHRNDRESQKDRDSLREEPKKEKECKKYHNDYKEKSKLSRDDNKTKDKDYHKKDYDDHRDKYKSRGDDQKVKDKENQKKIYNDRKKDYDEYKEKHPRYKEKNKNDKDKWDDKEVEKYKPHKIYDNEKIKSEKRHR